MTDYYQVLSSLHRALKPRSYLEIGVRDGASLRLAAPDTRCIGIDPQPGAIEDLTSICTIDATTSDASFADDRPRRALEGLPLDFAFIDGMHLFEYALRDFSNIERISHPGTTVALHDCLPRDVISSSRDRSTDFWTGDIWRLVLCLLDNRPDLEIVLLDAAPSGLCLIRMLDATNTRLVDNYSTLVTRYLNMSFAEWERRWKDTSQHLCSIESAIELAGGRNTDQDAPNGTLERPAAESGPRKRQPRLLGVLLCYNDADVLGDVIEHLARNGHHVVAWDHGSNDETASVLDHYSDLLIERRFVPREFDFYNLYPEMSRHLISEYSGKYDWISWPDDDEILEGPDRAATYQEYVGEMFMDGINSIRFDNFNYWVTAEDDGAIASPSQRVRRYCIFPECAPRIRSWRATVTNIREFNHNPLEGQQAHSNFRLRHYPARTYARLFRRIFMDRANLQRLNMNVHYNRLLDNISRVRIPAEYLHYDDGITDLSPEPIFDWLSIYGEPSAHASEPLASPPPVRLAEPNSTDDLLVGVAELIAAGDFSRATNFYIQHRSTFHDDPLMAQFDLVMQGLAHSMGTSTGAG